MPHSLREYKIASVQEQKFLSSEKSSFDLLCDHFVHENPSEIPFSVCTAGSSSRGCRWMKQGAGKRWGWKPTRSTLLETEAGIPVEFGSCSSNYRGS